MNIRQTIVILFMLLICISGVVFLFAHSDEIKWPLVTPTNAVAATATSTSTNTLFIARINIDTPCRFGTSDKFETITTIPQGRDVMVIGNNGNSNDWLLVRWGNYQDCWVESKFLTTYFDFGVLTGVPTSLLYTYTPVSTLTLMPSAKPSATLTPTPNPLISRTPTQRSGGGGVTATIVQPITSTSVFSTFTASNQTNTSPPTSTHPPPPTSTHPPPPTSTHPPPPTSTQPPPPDTPSGPRECNDGIDNDGDGATDYPADSGCRNNGDDSE